MWFTEELNLVAFLFGTRVDGDVDKYYSCIECIDYSDYKHCCINIYLHIFVFEY